MKDPSTEILSAISTALSGITYSGDTFNVYDSKPNINIKNYILLGELQLTDASTQDCFITLCNLDIEIASYGYYHQGSRLAVNSVASSIQQALIKNKLSMFSFTMVVSPFLIANRNIVQYISNEIVIKKLINIEFSVQQN